MFRPPVAYQRTGSPDLNVCTCRFYSRKSPQVLRVVKGTLLGYKDVPDCFEQRWNILARGRERN